MKISDLILMCVRNLTRRKFRTMLTVIGVVIGTCAIIVMISLGIGMGKAQEDMLASWGDLTVIEVWNYNPESQLDDESIAKIQAIEGVDVATPFLYYYEPRNIQLVSGKKDRYANRIQYNLVGIYPEALEKFGYALKEGEYLPATTNRKKIYLMLGENTAYDFQDTKKRWPNNYVSSWPDEYGNIADPFVDPFKDDILMKVVPDDETKGTTLEYEIEVTGILVGDYSKSYETMNGAFIDINELKRIRTEFQKANSIKNANNDDTYDNVRVKTTSIDNVGEIEQEIKDMGFSTYSMESERQSMQESARKTQMILGGLGAISLFVAAISITNTMIMSVYERTREIGVMKVLGCLVGNIRTIFLMEAGLIGFLGGLTGVGISYLLSYLMNTFSEVLSSGTLGNLLGGGWYYGESAQISIIPPWLVALGMCFATFIGLASGFYPANRAVKISALEAIKTE